MSQQRILPAQIEPNINQQVLRSISDGTTTTTQFVEDYSLSSDLFMGTAGQSNEVGTISSIANQGVINLPADASDPRILSYCKSPESWVTATLAGAVIGDKIADKNHMGFHFAKAFIADNPDRRVRLISTGEGGKAIGAFIPATSTLFKSMVEDYRKAFKLAGYTGKLHVFKWTHGEADHFRSNADYARDFEVFLQQLKDADIIDDTTAIITTQLKATSAVTVPATTNSSGQNGFFATINTNGNLYQRHVGDSYVADTPITDNVHWNHVDLRALGTLCWTDGLKVIMENTTGKTFDNTSYDSRARAKWVVGSGKSFVDIIGGNHGYLLGDSYIDGNYANVTSSVQGDTTNRIELKKSFGYSGTQPWTFIGQAVMLDADGNPGRGYIAGRYDMPAGSLTPSGSLSNIWFQQGSISNFNLRFRNELTETYIWYRNNILRADPTADPMLANGIIYGLVATGATNGDPMMKAYVNGFPIDENYPLPATATLAANFTDGQTFTVGLRTYTFRTTLTVTSYEVQIGGTLAISLANLMAAINSTGTPGVEYSSVGGVANSSATASATTATTITISASNDLTTCIASDNTATITGTYNPALETSFSVNALGWDCIAKIKTVEFYDFAFDDTDMANSYATLSANTLTSFTANNGLTNTGTATAPIAQLGGTLTANTSINQSTFNMDHVFGNGTHRLYSSGGIGFMEIIRGGITRFKTTATTGLTEIGATTGTDSSILTAYGAVNVKTLTNNDDEFIIGSVSNNRLTFGSSATAGLIHTQENMSYAVDSGNTSPSAQFDWGSNAKKPTDGSWNSLMTLKETGELTARNLNLNPLNNQNLTATGTINQNANVVTINASANMTVSLPAVATMTGRWLVIKRVDTTGFSVTLDANASETIDGALTHVIPAKTDIPVQLYSDGTQWRIISGTHYNPASNLALDATAYGYLGQTFNLPYFVATSALNATVCNWVKFTPDRNILVSNLVFNKQGGTNNTTVICGIYSGDGTTLLAQTANNPALFNGNGYKTIALTSDVVLNEGVEYNIALQFTGGGMTFARLVNSGLTNGQLTGINGRVGESTDGGAGVLPANLTTGVTLTNVYWWVALS